MRVVIVQKDINETDLTPYLEYAETRKADLICFGELGTSGALYQSRPVESLDAVLSRFAAYDIAIMTGMPYQADKGLRNSYLYYHRGEHRFYHKINLFPGMNEPAVYRPGSEPGLWNTQFGKLGVSICYDIRFPEIYSTLKTRGATKIFVPAAFPLVRIDDWRRLLIERAIENNVMMIGINAVGDDGTNVFGGNSMVVDAGGAVIAEADRRSRCVFEVEL
jgi:predicted amidohydrolase